MRDKKKLSQLRAAMCRMYRTTQTLQYPIHISLTEGSVIQDYSLFENELKKMCREQMSSFTIFCKENVTAIPKRFWVGISVKHSKALLNTQKKLALLQSRHSVKSNDTDFVPHISLAYPAKVNAKPSVKNPVVKMMFDRITIVRKRKGDNGYRIFRHIQIDQTPSRY